MSTLEFNLTKNRSAVRVAEFVAFVADKDTEQALKRFVLEEAMPHVHIAIGGVDDAIVHLSKLDRSPQFLLVDLQSSAMPLSDLGRLSEVCEPSVQVIALGERNDVGLFRSLLKLGVRDYLVKPLTVELLKRTVNVAQGSVNQVSFARTGKAIAFTGSRGGVGVTTIALNLARHLTSETHRRVAYIDLNLSGGSANTMLGIETNNGLWEVLQNAHRLDPQYLERTLVAKDGRLFVLSTEQDFGSRSAVDPATFQRALALLCDSFHYVFLDVDSARNPLAGAAFDAAKRVYVVSDRSVHSARQCMRLLRHIEDRDNTPQTSVVLNSPNAASHGKVQADDFAEAIGRSALHEFHFEPKSLQVAENLGEKPKEKSPNGFNQSIIRIANDLTGQMTKTELSLFSKLAVWRK
ncbi:AAA family ATPase [Paraburkholderia sp.]|uniref:AAA family ATPase n=1 Tax=Paraburkholderia sp. TaxID=1926495 RepID=UPI002F3F8A2D